MATRRCLWTSFKDFIESQAETYNMVLYCLMAFHSALPGRHVLTFSPTMSRTESRLLCKIVFFSPFLSLLSNASFCNAPVARRCHGFRENSRPTWAHGAARKTNACRDCVNIGHVGTRDTSRTTKVQIKLHGKTSMKDKLQVFTLQIIFRGAKKHCSLSLSGQYCFTWSCRSDC